VRLLLNATRDVEAGNDPSENRVAVVIGAPLGVEDPIVAGYPAAVSRGD
jgi:hypothetical protein